MLSSAKERISTRKSGDNLIPSGFCDEKEREKRNKVPLGKIEASTHVKKYCQMKIEFVKSNWEGIDCLKPSSNIPQRLQQQ